MAEKNFVDLESRTILRYHQLHVAPQAEPLVMSVPVEQDLVVVTISPGDQVNSIEAEVVVTAQISRKITGKPADGLMQCWIEQSDGALKEGALRAPNIMIADLCPK